MLDTVILTMDEWELLELLTKAFYGRPKPPCQIDPEAYDYYLGQILASAKQKPALREELMVQLVETVLRVAEEKRRRSK